MKIGHAQYSQMAKRLSIFVMLVLTSRADAKSLSLEKEAICLPVGSKVFVKRGAERKQYEIRLKSNLKFGPITIPKGCNLSLGYGNETTGKESTQELEAIRYVRAIGDCPAPFLLGGVKLFTAMFNPEGCLDGGQSLGEKKKICGKVLEPHQGIFFDNGFLDCTGRKEKEDSKL